MRWLLVLLLLGVPLHAQQVHRLGVTATTLMNPLGGVPLLSLTAGWRVRSNLSLVAVAFHPATLGKAPQVFVGLSFRLY